MSSLMFWMVLFEGINVHFDVQDGSIRRYQYSSSRWFCMKV